MIYHSPVTGRPLRRDTPHSLSDGAAERWPVVDGIAYLRIGSEPLARAALDALDAGREDAALMLLLAENDRWWTDPPPPPADLSRLIAGRDRLSLCDAMALLGWGRVGDYFAHRWTDPTFTAGLALIDAHWMAPTSAFELACGIGHHLRALSLAGVQATGADIVFAKLWVARHWVAPEACFVCFDADAPWPIRLRADLALCHDAFYFFGKKAAIADRLRAIAPLVSVAHIHNADHANLSGGDGMTLDAVRDLFPDAMTYTEEALSHASRNGVVPAIGATKDTEAFAVVIGGGQVPVPGPLSLPEEGRPLRRNPLCIDGATRWPSPRYRREYAERVAYRCDTTLPDRAIMAPRWADAARRRDLVDLPERWG